MRKIHLEKYKDKIKYLYFKRKLSLKKVANEIGVSAGTIRKNMVLSGIERRPSRKRQLTKTSKEKLKKLYFEKRMPIEKVAKRLDIGTTTLFRWLKEYKINPKRRWKYDKTNFSGDEREKAYILGLVAGDLHACRHHRQILVELTTTHPAMMNLFYSIFQKYGTPKKYMKHNRITGRDEWKVYILLNNSFEFMLTKDFDTDNKYFYNFLAGFFDSEGCLYIYNNHGYIGLSALIYNSDKKLLEIIKERLERDGFHPKFSRFFKKGEKTTDNYSRGIDLWVIRLHTNKEVLSLMDLMHIKHKEKLNKLKIAKSANNKWGDISDQICTLKKSIKEEIREYINPLNSKLK